MQILKISVFVLIAATVTAVAFGQKSNGSSKQVAKPATVKPSHPSSAAQSKPILSANPLVGKGLAERNAAYASAFAFTKQARTLFASGDLAGAEAACNNALNAAPVIQGKKRPVPFVPLLLGQIYLKAGQNKKAVYWLQGAHQSAWSSGLNLDLALAYVRLGDYKDALQHYSDTAITQYTFGGKKVDPSDLPGTDSPQALEASILLARGIDSYGQEANADATDDFAAADRLAPGNPLLNYYWSDALLRLNRFEEAIPHAQIAAAHAHGHLTEFARRKLISAHSSTDFIASHPNYFAQHPDQAPKYHD